MSLAYLFDVYKKCSYCFEESPAVFEKNLNKEFSRLNYAYRIVDHFIIEITSDEEIRAVEKAIARRGGCSVERCGVVVAADLQSAATEYKDLQSAKLLSPNYYYILVSWAIIILRQR